MASTNTAQVSGADITLFHVALRQFGNPLLAVQIAAANQITDPWLVGLATIVIPTEAAPDTGGLPSPGILP